MAELKTQENDSSVEDFLDSVDDSQKREDAKALLKLFSSITGEPATMWGDSIVGFGKIHYVYASGREGDWMATGFSPRKNNLSLYVLGSYEGVDELLQQLGPHSRGKSCLYVKRLEDVDTSVLKKLIKKSFVHANKTQSAC